MDGRKLIAKAVENWPAKVLSLGLAIVLFIFHRMTTLEDRFFSVPLIIERKGTLMPSSPYPRMIRVGLRGEANSIYPVVEDDIETYIDMEKFDVPGVYTVPVQWRKKGTALGVETLQITVDPMEVTLSLDNKISKVVPLTANLRGQVETGYTLTSYSLNPAQVVIDGPAELVWSISEVFTDAIDLDGRSGDFSVMASILNQDPLMVMRGNGTTEFLGIVSQIVAVRNIIGVPISVTGLMEGFSAELETKSGIIHLEGGPQNVLEQFEPPPDFLRVDCSGISMPGTYVLKVTAGTAGSMVLKIEPEEVTIEIRAGDEEP